MLDVVLPRGHPLVIDDVGRSYRWLAKALLGGARGARRRAARRDSPRGRRAAAAERAAARLACFAGTGTYELVTLTTVASSSGLAQRRRGGRRAAAGGCYVAAPRLDVAASLGLPRDQEERLRERLARVATLDEVAPGFAEAPPPAGGARAVTTHDRAAPARPVQPAHDARRRARRHAAAARRRRGARVRDAGGAGARARRAARATARCAIALDAPDDAVRARPPALPARASTTTSRRSSPWPSATTCWPGRWRARAACAQPRTGTCVHALVRAVSPGQLVTFSRGAPHRARDRAARRPPARGARCSRPTAPASRASRRPRSRPAAWRSRRASALVRISQLLDLERLATAPPDGAAARLLRERQLGPWSVGTFFLYGLGRYDRGLVGDLGLIRLCGELLGRRAEAEDTAELLGPLRRVGGPRVPAPAALRRAANRNDGVRRRKVTGLTPV